MISFFGIVHGCGGCGTEALGAIELLRSKSVPVRCIVPTGDPCINEGNANADYLRSLGVELRTYEPGLFSQCPILMSFGEHKLFEYIKENDDRPGWVVYSDCMYYVTDNEVEQYAAGYIDEFFFQTKALEDKHGPEICKRAGKPVKGHGGYKAYLNPRSSYFPLPFSNARDFGTFRVCRVTRDDEDKWHPDTWRMFASITAPCPITIEVAGWGMNGASKIGDPTTPGNKWNGELNLSCHSQRDLAQMSGLYSVSHVLLHICDPAAEESLGRTFLEAMASGVVVIADNRGGAKELIRNGETGFLVSSPDEAAFRASEMAFYPARRRAIVAQAYAALTHGGHADPEACWPWWKRLLDLHGGK